MITGAIVSVAAAGGFAWWSKHPLTTAEPPIEFTITPGSGVNAAAQQMAKAGVPIDPFLFQVLARVTGDAGRIKAGSYELKPNTSPRRLLTQLVRGEFAQEAVTIIEGWTFRQMREAIAATTAAGTPTALGLQRFGHFNGVVKRNGTALGNVVSAEITYANNLDRIETIRSDGRIDGADPSIAALTGRIEVRFADQTLVTQAINGEACEMEFAYVLPSGESFTFTVHAVYLPRPRIEIPGPQGIQATFDWQAAKATSPARMCTAVLVNTVTGY